jgi:hypothetical protein
MREGSHSCANDLQFSEMWGKVRKCENAWNGHRRGFPLSMSSLVMHPSTNPDIYPTYLEMGNTDAAIDISRMFMIIGLFRKWAIIIQFKVDISKVSENLAGHGSRAV